MIVACPTCGQPLLERYGVKLQRKKVELLDLIDHQTRYGDGIAIDRLAWHFYPDDPKPTACQRIRVHINQLNDLLESTDWSVVNRDGRYRLVRAEGA